jgi:TolB-like protein/Tfp pilus assembly protein PilF
VTPKKPGFFEELKRRHVWRVAIAYAITGWLIVQIATQVFPFFNIPNWAVRLVIILVVIGFPVALALAWVYEITPEGIRRTEPADSPDARSEHTHRNIGRRLNAVIITVLVLAVGLLGWRLYAVRHVPAAAAHVATATRNPDGASRPDGAKRYPGKTLPDSAAAAAVSGLHTTANAATPAPAASVPQKSVAVLPFANDSDQKDQQFFSDGLSQDLITALSQFAGLKVINRNSAFQFRDSKDNIKIVAQKLGVAHLLEGSVQKQGGKVRVTATLINAADGSILWSQRYDKPYKDLFALQDDITRSVAGALQAKLLSVPGTVAQSERPPSGNLEAWKAYQQGKFHAMRATQADLRTALAQFTAATRLDPRYAAAYARLSYVWNDMATQYLAGTAQQQAYANARRAANTTLAPDSALMHSARGKLLLLADLDWRGAQAEFKRAQQLAPNDAGVLFNLGSLDATLGRVQSAVELTRTALAGDPLHANWYDWLSIYLSGLGRLDEAEQMVRKAIELQPTADAFREQQAVIAIQRGDAKGALAAAQRESDEGWHRIALALALQIGPDRAAADAALQTLIAKYADRAPYQIAEVYALRRDPGKAFEWLQRAWAARDPGIGLLLHDPFILRYRDDPRFAAFCKKVDLPTTTDAVAM